MVDLRNKYGTKERKASSIAVVALAVALTMAVLGAIAYGKMSSRVSGLEETVGNLQQQVYYHEWELKRLQLLDLDGDGFASTPSSGPEQQPVQEGGPTPSKCDPDAPGVCVEDDGIPGQFVR